MSKQIDRVIFYSDILTGAMNFFKDGTGNNDSLLKWMQETKENAERLAHTLVIDNPEISPLLEELEAVTLAADLCLKTWGIKDYAEMTLSDSVILVHFEGHTPWAKHNKLTGYWKC